ncbi:MAG: hypothetical protein JXO51_09815 [Candidatus Aminicenantes bacterium]|nr:hypothetical protein [Candidatus Aminicenantes bacterium]
MKKLPLLLLLALNLPAADEWPDFKVGDIIVVENGFIALKIENSSPYGVHLSPSTQERVFLGIAINGIKRAEYKVKAVDPTIFQGSSMIMLKTNFRVGQPLRIRVEVNGGKAVPESDFANNILEKDLRPPLE